MLSFSQILCQGKFLMLQASLKKKKQVLTYHIECSTGNWDVLIPNRVLDTISHQYGLNPLSKLQLNLAEEEFLGVNWNVAKICPHWLERNLTQEDRSWSQCGCMHIVELVFLFLCVLCVFFFLCVCYVTINFFFQTGPCRQCFCRPMWCLSCMSKWFAARQNQHTPESWMASHAPCPMCRATFCMLDIQKVEMRT